MDINELAAAANAPLQSSLNAALGNLGGRKKSWMVDAPAAQPNAPRVPPVLPSTRPPLPPLPSGQKRPRGRPRKHVLAVPLSASVSPQLANLASPKHAESSSARAHITVFPSPSPSEDATVTTAAAAATPTPTSTPTPTPTSHELASAPSTTPHVLALHQDNPSDAPITPQEPTSSELPCQPSSALQSNALLPHPPTPASPLVEHASNPSFGTHTNLHTPLAPSADEWYTAQDCWEAINRFQHAFAPSPAHHSDARRLAVIKEAIYHRDWAYLTLHQYYCLLSHDQMAAPMALRVQQKLPQAVSVLRDVLGANNDMSPVYNGFFAAFPAPIDVLGVRWPRNFQLQGRQFLQFVINAPDYHVLRLTCDQRRHPPLARELAVDYKIVSPTFQRLLFTSCLRWIYRTLPPSSLHSAYENQALAIFEQNKAAFHQRELASDTLPSRDFTEEIHYYGQQLRNLLEKHKAIVQQHHLSADAWPSPLHTSRPQSYPYVASTPVIPSNAGPGDRLNAPGAMQQTRARGRPTNRPVLHHASNSSARSIPDRPPYRSSAVSRPHFMPPQAQVQSRPPVPLLPPSGWLQPQQRIPCPERFALHQAHLRSPTLQATSPPSPLHCFQQGYVLSPVRLPGAVKGIEALSFSMTADQMELIARDVTSEPGHHCTRSISEKSKILRLRCIKWPITTMPNDSEWATADSAWIPYSYLTFNDTSLQQRRKIHHGKDQPIDLTHLVRQGSNTLQVTIMSPSTNDNAHLNYLVAVEILGFKSHDAIKRTCLTSRRIPASTILDTIKKKLSANSDDEDLAVIESNLTITLFDPFSASAICAIPARSHCCAHNDCFDLDTFLVTRPRKGDVSAPDAWRCPICKADARPNRLIVDGFLEQITRDLQRKGLESTRAILVQADGAWTPKAEIREGVSDETPPPESRWADKEIIDLSD